MLLNQARVLDPHPCARCATTSDFKILRILSMFVKY
jgi:hypothetical protein